MKAPWTSNRFASYCGPFPRPNSREQLRLRVSAFDPKQTLGVGVGVGIAIAIAALAVSASPQAPRCEIPEAIAGGPLEQHACYVRVYQTPWPGQARQTEVSLTCMAGNLLAPTTVLRLRAKGAASVRWQWTSPDLLRIE